MLEKIICNSDKVNILQCEEIAKDAGFDSVRFDLCGPTGEIPCKWLDAYMGMFCTEDDTEHFLMSRQFQYNPDVYCKNIRFEESPK